MSGRYSDNGNRRAKPSPPPQQLTVSDFKLEFILTGVMLGFVAVVYIVLSALGITPGLKELCSGRDKEPTSESPAHIAEISDADSPVSGADSAPKGGETFNMGTYTLFFGRTAPLFIDGEELVSFSSSNESVASVDAEGMVTPVSVGSSEMSCKSASGNTYTWHFDVMKVAYLTFSDFPNDSTGRILDVLRDKNVKATFFVCKTSKEEYFPLYRRMIDEGHTVGNHTSSHDVNELFKGPDEFKSSVVRLENFLDLQFSFRTKYVSIPNGTGSQDQNTVATQVTRELHDMGYTLVDWTVEVGGYREMTRQEILTAVRDKVKNDREIISMHNYSETAKALPDIISYLSSQGYGFETVADAPEVYNQYYGWEININRRGAGTYTKDMLSGFQYTQS